MSESYSTLLYEPWICCEKFPKLLKEKRVVAWCLRFINNIKVRRKERRLGELSVCEIQKAEQILIGLAQKEGFPHEIMALKLGHLLPAKSALGQLNPVLDSDRLFRVGGGLELAKHLSAETRNPILLPRKSHITTLIVAYHHEQRKHSAGTNHVLSDIRTQFWIIRGREAVKSSRCNECKEREDVLRPPDKSWWPFLCRDLECQWEHLQNVEWITQVLFSQSREEIKSDRKGICVFSLV